MFNIENMVVDGQFNFGGLNLGFDLDFQQPTAGFVDIFQSIDTDFFLPDSLSVGETAQFGTFGNFDPGSAAISGESLSAGGVNLNLDALLGQTSLEVDGFVNVFDEPFIDADINVDVDTASQDDITLIEITPGSVASTEPGTSLSVSLPDGNSATNNITDSGNPSFFEPLSVTITDTIISGGIDVIEFLSNRVPQLRVLDILSGEFMPRVIDGPGDGFQFEGDYTLLEFSASLDLDLVQTISFIPTSIQTTFEVEGVTQTGTLGDEFDFEIVETPDGSLDGSISYQLLGNLAVEYGLALGANASAELLSASGSLTAFNNDNSSIDIQLGPVANPDVSGIFSGTLRLFSTSVSIGSDVFNTVIETFSISTEDRLLVGDLASNTLRGGTGDDILAGTGPSELETTGYLPIDQLLPADRENITIAGGDNDPLMCVIRVLWTYDCLTLGRVSAHLSVYIKRRGCGIASAVSRLFFV